MWLTSTSIRRPIFIAMFVIALIVMGLQSRSKMAKENIPNTDVPIVTIITTYPGAGPSEIETLVTEPIEKAVTSIGNLNDVSSTSQEGNSMVTLEFEYGTNIEAAAADVRDKVASVKASLPKDADESKVVKLDISSMPVMTIGLAGDLTPKEMRLLADNVVSDKLAKVGGVASVNVSGGEEREISVSVDKRRLDAYGIGIGSVVNALQGANKNNPAGSIKEDAREYTIRTVGEFTDASGIANAPISLSGTGDASKDVIHVSDVARIVDGVKEPTKTVRLNGKPSVIFTIQKQSGANTVAIAQGVKKELADLQPLLPASVHPVIATDDSISVERSLEAVNSSLLEGILLVVLIVFLFLHTARATFIVALAIPTSLMATYVPIGALGFTQNTMVLLALSLVVGILVDDSIVVLENIERHLRLKERPEEAAINGRSEIGLAAIAITMVDIVVFLPIAFMGGMLGQYFRQFGITVAVATAFSLLMSFTLTPMLASRWMKAEIDKERDAENTKRRAELGMLTFKDRLDILSGRVFGVLEAFLRGLDRRYRGVLEWALENRFLTVSIGIVSLLVVVAMATSKGGGTAAGGPPPLNARLLISFVTLVLTATAMAVNRRSKGVALIFGVSMIIMAMTIHLPFGFEFFPQNDDGQLKIAVRTPAGTSLAATDRIVSLVEGVVSGLPEMKTVHYPVSDSRWWSPPTWGRHHTESETGYVMAMVGSGTSGMAGSGDTGSQYANITVQLVDKRHRKRSTQEVVDWISQETAHVPGAELITVSVSSSGSGPGGGLEKQVQGQKREDVVAMANRVAEAMRKVPGTLDVDISYKPNTPERRIVVDKYRAAKMGMSVSEVSTAVRTAIDGDDTVKLRQGGTEYPIRVHYELSQRNKASDVDSLIIGTRNGAPIYLSDVARVESAFAPNKIERINRQQVVSVTANVAGGYQMGNVNTTVDTALAQLPKIAGTTVGSGGTSKRMGEAFVSIFSAMLLVVILVYMLMGALFESFLTPFVVMFSLPQAMVGALLALLLTGQSMGITAMIGIIMLMGLVSKNAILLIDYTNTLMSRGMSRNEALLEAGPTRLRPILMTTLAMVGGMLPTALALSQGSETRSPMATAVIGGLILSTVLTLVVIPVVFTIVDDAWKWLLRSFFPGAYRKSIAKQNTPEREPVTVDR